MYSFKVQTCTFTLPKHLRRFQNILSHFSGDMSTNKARVVNNGLELSSTPAKSAAKRPRDEKCARSGSAPAVVSAGDDSDSDTDFPWPHVLYEPILKRRQTELVAEQYQEAVAESDSGSELDVFCLGCGCDYDPRNKCRLGDMCAHKT